MRNNARRTVTGALVTILAFAGTSVLAGQEETGAIRPDTVAPSGDTVDTGTYAPPRSDSGTYAPPDSATYAPPRSDSGTYAPPDSATYAPPQSDRGTSAPPDTTATPYAPPVNTTTGPPQGAGAHTSQDSRELLVAGSRGTPQGNPE